MQFQIFTDFTMSSSALPSENDTHTRLRMLIRRVQADERFSPKEKQRRVQALMRGDLTAADWPLVASSPKEEEEAKAVALEEERRRRTPSSLFEKMSENDKIVTLYKDGIDVDVVSDSSSSNDESADDEDVAMETNDNNDGADVPKHVESQSAATTTTTKDDANDNTMNTSSSPRKPLGCKHYMRGCKYLSECCGRWFGCRVCHDEEVTDHVFPRERTEFIFCMHCQTVQPFDQHCGTCKKRLAKYVCTACRFHDDHPTKQIYHCNKCGICRIGSGLDDDFFHCDRCACCLAISLKDNHKCIEGALSADCPVCGQDLSRSREPCVFLKCGHAMHNKCRSEYVRTNYVCPLCSSSMFDMSAAWSEMDQILNSLPMPEEYREVRSHILCNDCLERCETAFHFHGHKCESCGSYNTRVTRYENMPEILRAGQSETNDDEEDEGNVQE